MESRATSAAPLLAVYMDFDLNTVAELVELTALRRKGPQANARSLISSPMERGVRETLLRLLTALADPLETAALGQQLLRELHYRVLTGAQAPELIAALRNSGGSASVGRSLAYIRRSYRQPITIRALAAEAGMSVPAFHSRFRKLIGSTPLNYIGRSACMRRVSSWPRNPTPSPERQQPSAMSVRLSSVASSSGISDGRRRKKFAGCAPILGS